MRNRVVGLAFFFLLFFYLITSIGAGRPLGGDDSVFILKKNGGWCWYQDPRAIVNDRILIFGSVAGKKRDGSSPGDIEVTSRDLASGKTEFFKLHPRLQADDHDAPSFLSLPDGRILAGYMMHGDDRLMRWRISRAPWDVRAWSRESSTDVGAGVSYTNLFMLDAESNRIYNFHRGIGWNPNFMISDDLGESFYYGGRLLNRPRPVSGDKGYSGLDGGRPYLKYASDGESEIHFVATEDHPRAFDNSIYHGYIKSGNLFRSDGGLLGSVSKDPEGGYPVDVLTRVFKGDEENVAWTIDLELDRQGFPVVLFSVQKGDQGLKNTPGEGGLDHRYWYGWWNGQAWQTQEIAFAGTRLYAGEDDYTGLAAIDPADPDLVYISTNADPETGVPLISDRDGKRHWEIFRGRRASQGVDWRWTPVTRNSKLDNIRPVVPNGETDWDIVLWLRGVYRAYTDYDLDVVGLIK